MIATIIWLAACLYTCWELWRVGNRRVRLERAAGLRPYPKRKPKRPKG